MASSSLSFFSCCLPSPVVAFPSSHWRPSDFSFVLHPRPSRPPRFRNHPLAYSGNNASSETPLSTITKQRDTPQPLSVEEGGGGGEEEVGVQARSEEEQEELSQQTLLWRAIKLPIYSVALIPLSVGSSAAYWQTGVFHLGRFLIILASSVLVIAWLNLSNDVYDAETGVDKGKRESVVNMTGSCERVLAGAQACLLLGAMGLIWGAWQAHNMQIAALLGGAIACGYVYQCPPFRLSYRGLGEPLCFIAFGPLATTAFYLSQASARGANILPVTMTVLAAAALVGITTTLILFCSHFHQIEGDKLVGKLSPLVRLGTGKGKDVVMFAVVGLYLLSVLFATGRALPYPCALFSFLTIPIGSLVVNFVSKNHDNKEKIFLAKYYCVRLHVAFGAALALGFVTAARAPLVFPS